MCRRISATAAIFSAALLFCLPVGRAQSPEGEAKRATVANAVEKIQAESEGNVEIIMPDDILNLIFSVPEVEKKESKGLRPGINKTNGYRIQVFSDGRNQHSLEARAKARGSAIVARFPKYRGQVYTFSKSPNWYTRVGNFRNASEASAALAELKRAFPSFASEMRMIKSQIVLIRQ